MVLADDNFATIIVAVEEGRKVFSNIKNQSSTSCQPIWPKSSLSSSLHCFGWDVLQPVHLLWINLVTDTLPAIALGVEPAEPGIMTHKPRGRQSNFFDGGVFGAIIYQNSSNYPCSCTVLWLGSCLPQNTIRKEPFTQMPLQWLCNTLV